MIRKVYIACFTSFLISTPAWTAEAPTRAQLERELSVYLTQAKLRGNTEPLQGFRGIPYDTVFDLFLTVMEDPNHPKHQATKKAWDSNYNTFRKEAPMVSRLLGNLIPLLAGASDLYAKEYAVGSKRYSPNFNAKNYVQPLAVVVKNGTGVKHIAWYHAEADADCDGIDNAKELLTIAPKWRTTKETGWLLKSQTQLGVTEAQRKLFIKAALGTDSGCYTTDID